MNFFSRKSLDLSSLGNSNDTIIPITQFSSNSIYIFPILKNNFKATKFLLLKAFTSTNTFLPYGFTRLALIIVVGSRHGTKLSASRRSSSNEKKLKTRCIKHNALITK